MEYLELNSEGLEKSLRLLQFSNGREMSLLILLHNRTTIDNDFMYSLIYCYCDLEVFVWFLVFLVSESYMKSNTDNRCMSHT